MTNLSLSQMEQVTDGEVASKLWEQIVFAGGCRQTASYWKVVDFFRGMVR